MRAALVMNVASLDGEGEGWAETKAQVRMQYPPRPRQFGEETTARFCMPRVQ
jgi:hypothetical protein